MSVFVAGIQPESVAAKDGRIEIGDELLEVKIPYHSIKSHLELLIFFKFIINHFKFFFVLVAKIQI